MMQPTSTIIPCVFSLLLRMNAPTVYNVEHTPLTHKKTSILNALLPEMIHKIFACAELSTQKALRCTCSTLYNVKHTQLTHKKTSILNALLPEMIHKIFACAELPTQKALRCTCSTLYALDIKNILRHSPLVISQKDHLKWMIYAAHNDDPAIFANLLCNAFGYKNPGGYHYAEIGDTVSYFLPEDHECPKILLFLYFKYHNPAILQELLPYFMAIYRGEEQYIRNYVIKSIWWPQMSNIPPLYIATRNNHISVLEILLSTPSNQIVVDVNERVFSGYTALHLAAYHNLWSAGECLLEHGADVNITDEKNCTPLRLACSNRSTEMVTLLLAYKADPTIGGQRDKPLHGAIINNHSSVVKLLIEYGADLNEKYNEQTPLIMAVDKQNYEVCYDICEFLVKNGANIDEVDSDGFTALMLAVMWGHLPIIELLLKYGANIHHQAQKSHDTALSLALEGNYKPIIKLLLEQPNIQINAKEQRLLTRLNNRKKKKTHSSKDHKK